MMIVFLHPFQALLDKKMELWVACIIANLCSSVVELLKSNQILAEYRKLFYGIVPEWPDVESIVIKVIRYT